MPIYEYQCQACGHQFETTQRITEDPLKDCPTCSAPQLQRLISSTAFMLKGGGWYKDGYGKPGKERTENQVTDRLTKAINDDKKKTAEAAAATADSSSAGGSTGSAPGSGGGTSSTPSSGGGSTPASGGSSSGGST
jgi:putative FmdB family regulatory protein